MRKRCFKAFPFFVIGFVFNFSASAQPESADWRAPFIREEIRQNLPDISGNPSLKSALKDYEPVVKLFVSVNRLLEATTWYTRATAETHAEFVHSLNEYFQSLEAARKINPRLVQEKIIPSVEELFQKNVSADELGRLMEYQAEIVREREWLKPDTFNDHTKSMAWYGILVTIAFKYIGRTTYIVDEISRRKIAFSVVALAAVTSVAYLEYVKPEHPFITATVVGTAIFLVAKKHLTNFFQDVERRYQFPDQIKRFVKMIATRDKKQEDKMPMDLRESVAILEAMPMAQDRRGMAPQQQLPDPVGPPKEEEISTMLRLIRDHEELVYSCANIIM